MAEDWTRREHQDLLEKIQLVCVDFGFGHTSAMAKKAINRPPKVYGDILSELTHLHDSLSHELDGEFVFRVPSERRAYYESSAGFGPDVADAFPSCARDILKA